MKLPSPAPFKMPKVRRNGFKWEVESDSDDEYSSDDDDYSSDEDSSSDDEYSEPDSDEDDF